MQSVEHAMVLWYYNHTIHDVNIKVGLVLEIWIRSSIMIQGRSA